MIILGFRACLCQLCRLVLEKKKPMIEELREIIDRKAAMGNAASTKNPAMHLCSSQLSTANYKYL